MTEQRRLAVIVSADVAGYSPCARVHLDTCNSLPPTSLSVLDEPG
jgi:hypothetical protein